MPRVPYIHAAVLPGTLTLEGLADMTPSRALLLDLVEPLEDGLIEGDGRETLGLEDAINICEFVGAT